MSKHKILTFKYKDGATVSQVWLEPYDGPWLYGDLDEKIIIKKYNFYTDDTKDNIK